MVQISEERMMRKCHFFQKDFIHFFRYGDSEFSAHGIKLAVDLFQSYGYPDSKIVVILPAHYLSKDKDHVLQNLCRRKIVHKAFQQKTGDQFKRFYDDR
jgi:hypothetical protein